MSKVILISTNKNKEDCRRYYIKNKPFKSKVTINPMYGLHIEKEVISHFTINGSMLQSHGPVNKDEKKNPFIPILGDAWTLKDFGRAVIVYTWLKRINTLLFEILYDLFVTDKICIYFITSEKYAQVLLDEDEIVLKEKIVGVMEKTNGRSTMTLYIYYKKKIPSK